MPQEFVVTGCQWQRHACLSPGYPGPGNGVCLAVKRYYSEKVPDPEHEWHHRRITFACDTLESGYEDIVLEGAEIGELQVLGELRGILDLEGR